jgi:hypothetical protein
VKGWNVGAAVLLEPLNRSPINDPMLPKLNSPPSAPLPPKRLERLLPAVFFSRLVRSEVAELEAEVEEWGALPNWIPVRDLEDQD